MTRPVCSSTLIRLLLGTLPLFTSSLTWANNGERMIGYSARSNAMGGAVTATPQDASTGLTNPAGLAFLGLGDDNMRFDMTLNAANPEASLNGVYTSNDLFVMAVGGIAFKSDLLPKEFTVGVGAYAVSGGGIDYPGFSYSKYPGFDGIVSAVRMGLRMGPSIAYNITDDLAVGLTGHLTVNQFGVSSPILETPVDFSLGFVWGAGLVYNLTPTVRIGLAYDAKTNNEKYEFNTVVETDYPGCTVCPAVPQRLDLDFQDPQSAALGISYQPTPKLQLEFDIKWIDYQSERHQWILEDVYGNGVNDIELDLGWDSQWVYAFGANYKPKARWELMLGYNYGKSPIQEEDIGRNPGLSAIVEHHLSLGLAYEMNKHTTVNLAYNHGFSNTMTGIRPASTEPVTVSFETNMFFFQAAFKY